MVDKSKLPIATSQIQNPIPFLIELLFNLLSQMITISTIKLTSQPVIKILYHEFKEINVQFVESKSNTYFPDKVQV
jgi:hypothetical protein